MASLSAFPPSKPTSPFSLSTSPSSALSPLHPHFSFKLRSQFKNSIILSALKFRKQPTSRCTVVKAEAEEDPSPPLADAATDQAVSVAVSPSDVLTMFFQAEGTMVDSAVPVVTKALELTKQTTVQATGVASNLVEIIQGSGFKLQTLNLSFYEEEDSS